MVSIYNDRPCLGLYKGDHITALISEYFVNINKYKNIVVNCIVENPVAMKTPCHHIRKRYFSNLDIVHIARVEYRNSYGNIVSGFVDPWLMTHGKDTMCNQCCWYNSNFTTNDPYILKRVEDNLQLKREVQRNEKNIY